VGSSPRLGWPRRILDIVGAACAALLAFTAVPIVLVVIVGNPLGGGLGHDWRPLPQATLCILVLAAWVAWAACCAQLLRAVVAHVRTGEVGLRRGSSVLDRVAARIAFGVLALTSIGTPLTLAAEAGASVPVAHASISVPATLPGGTVAGAVADPLRMTAGSYTVQPGDTLWRIAAEQLEDGADWTSLARLNLGRDLGGGGGGGHFVDPDQLREGWRLRLPTEARRSTDGDGRDGGHGNDSDVGHQSTRPAPPGHLPELVALGLGSVACAALARRARRRRRLGAQFSAELMLQPSLSEGAQDVATLVQRFDGVPALRSLEAANSLLGLALEGRPARPKVRAICVSPSGVTFCFADARADEPPHGFTRADDGAAWHVSHSMLEGHDPCFPLLPVVFPVGDDDEGTWLVPLEPGDVLPLLGEAAPALWRAARGAIGSWAWSETVLVTEDADDPALRAETLADPSIARHVLFCGDPAALPPQVVGRCAVVTMEPVAGSDLTVLVDRHAATLHPMGLVVRPHLQSSATAQHIAELLAPLPGSEEEGPGVAGRPETNGMGGGGGWPEAQGAGALSPGTVDVRLLTMTPRIDGLNEDLPPNRARRAVELVAYLALHQPDVITSDRLRTRVLGSSDADAAAKTLFNTAYAARRALGVDEQGDPLFPAGTRQGLYQLSPQVTVDVQRAVVLVAEGKAQSDPAAAIAYLRAALELVEGEPLANALSGYAWWEAEGHGGRIAAVLVDAACLMAALAADERLFELARWGLEQARVVEPYSEALSRAAMQLAAAEGDADRLRLEWRDCQRRIDTLDPGGSPSARTEALYGELSRRVLVGVALVEDGAPHAELDWSD
jgi:DNA-binding SARP family transcriptional activator